MSTGQVVELDAAFVFAGARIEAITDDVYAAARASVTTFWQQSLATAPTFTVPEPQVQHAELALEVVFAGHPLLHLYLHH